MKNVKDAGSLLSAVLAVAVCFFLFRPFTANAALEQSFDVLKIGTTTYRNVTVTTKSKNYIFILHATGMTNIKVSDLPPDLRTQLGYDLPPAPEAKTNSPAVWARQALGKIAVPQVKQLETGLLSLYHAGPSAKVSLPALSRNFLLLGAGVLLVLYLFHSYCCMLICRKTGAEPGLLVWLPVLQLLPLLKAAGMSPWWFLAFLVPGINFVAQLVWFVKISVARGKGIAVALLLIFPLTSPFAVMYLAFSGAPRPRKETRRVEIMTLEAA